MSFRTTNYSYHSFLSLVIDASDCSQLKLIIVDKIGEQVQLFKTRIANAKRKITNFALFIDRFDPERDFPALERRIQDLDKHIEFDESHPVLETLVDDPSYAGSRTEYEEKYYAAYGQAATLLRSVSRPEPIAPSSSQSILPNDQANNVQASKRKLPPLSLPFFSGSYESWLGFHDIFKSLVDDDKDLPAREKLYHLKGCLKDEAAEILSSLDLSSENYKVTWGLLKERYDNRKIIRQTHVNSLLKMQSIAKDFPVRSLIDQVRRLVRALEALKEPIDKWDTLLVAIIEEKLIFVIRIKWEDFSCESTNFQGTLDVSTASGTVRKHEVVSGCGEL